MSDERLTKTRKNFMLTLECIDCLESLKEDIFPELSYSQIVDKAIKEYADRKGAG